MYLLDSDVVIDILRQHQPALRWLDSTVEVPHLPGYVVMELIEGCRNREEVEGMLRRIKPFPVCWSDPSECENLLQQFAAAHLSHKISTLDMLIGACALAHGAILLTFNEKHFHVIPDLQYQPPYRR